MLNFFLLVTLCTALARSIPQFLTKPRHHGHIVGGIDATIEEYPHQVAVYERGLFRCGGNIYSKNVVISAAHCFQNPNPLSYNIYVGAGHLNKKNIGFLISKIYNHEKYFSKTNDYDISILIINGQFEFNNQVQPIALAESRPLPGTEVIVIGWGRTSSDGPPSDQLQQVYVNIVDQKDCNEAYESGFRYVTNNMICASANEREGGSCKGDSGGPLILDKKLLGIVSWGHKKCGSKDYPGVYASIPNLRDWILKTVQKYNALLK